MSDVSPLRLKSIQLGIEALSYAKMLRSSGLATSVIPQFERSASAVGALIAEAGNAESKADMNHKFGIALKEARETKYWIVLLQSTTTVAQSKQDIISKLLHEVTAMLVSSRKTLQAQLYKKTGK